MNRLFELAAIIALLCFPMKIAAQYQLIELADVQSAKSLGAIIQDPTGAPISKAQVQNSARVGKQYCAQRRLIAMDRFHSPQYGVEESTSFRFRQRGLIRCGSDFMWTPSGEPASN